MRLHITLDDDVVERVDKAAGPRGRSRFIVEAVLEALEDAARADLLEEAFGAIDDEGHEWDADPAGWVRAQRRADPRRGG